MSTLHAVTGLRIVGWVAAGLVIGFALGGIPAERERVELEDRVARLERSLARADRPNILDSFLPQLGREAPQTIAGGPLASETPAGSAQPRASPDAGTRERDTDALPGSHGDVAVIGESPGGERRGPFREMRERRRARRSGFEVRLGDREARRGRRGEAPDNQDLPPLERFDQMAQVQRARAAASRVALIEQAGLNEGQVAQVDATVQRMNDQLAGYGEEMIDQMVREEAPSPAQALGLGHDVSGILLDGQKELESIVGEAAEDVDPSAMEVWNYVDIEQWRPAIEEQLKKLPAQGAAPPTTEGAGAGSDAPPPVESEE